MVGFSYTGERLTQKIRELYLRAVFRQNIAFFDFLGSGEITTRITADMNLVQDGVSQKVALVTSGFAMFVSVRSLHLSSAIVPFAYQDLMI